MNKFHSPARALFFRLFAVAFVLLTLIICNPSGLYFLCDDFIHVPLSATGSFFPNHLLRPFQYLTLWVDSKFWGMDPEGYHFTNLCIHLINTGLFLLLAQTIYKRYIPKELNVRGMVIMATLLFLCYGYHSEPIFWILGRGGSLAACFIQLSILCYLRGSIPFRVLGIISFGLGLFTYELTWILPLLLTALYLFEKHHQKKISSYLPITLYWNVLTLYLFYRYSVLKGSLGGYGMEDLFQLDLIGIGHKWVALAGRLFVPPLENTTFFVFGLVTVIVLLCVALFKVFKQSKDIFALALLLIACMAICLLPVASLGIDTHDTEGERVIYPATMFACLLILLLANTIFSQHFAYYTFCICALIFHTYFLYQASLDYRHASYVSRFTIESLNTVPGVRKLTITNLPTQYKGALMFRFMPTRAPGILATDIEGFNIRSVQEITEKKKYKSVIRATAGDSEHLSMIFTHDSLILY